MNEMCIIWIKVESEVVASGQNRWIKTSGNGNVSPFSNCDPINLNTC